MKTGMDILQRAMSLLGYTNAAGEVDAGLSAELYRRGLDILNQVLADIWPLEHAGPFRPLTSIHEKIPLSSGASETTLPYGVAMFLAQSDGDGGNQQFYAALYQQKRNAVRRPPRFRDDVMPSVWGGLTCGFQIYSGGTSIG